MKFNTQVKVLGMKANKGTMDNGQAYDSTKVFVETALDGSKGNAKGFAVAEYALGLSAEFDKYKHLPFPFMADATVEIMTTGKVQKTVLSELRPIEMVKQKAA